jgi:hypothetical protein
MWQSPADEADYIPSTEGAASLRATNLLCVRTFHIQLTVIQIHCVILFSIPEISIQTTEQLHSELVAELRLRDCVEQAEMFECFGARESELFLASFGMTLSKALEKAKLPGSELFTAGNDQIA